MALSIGKRYRELEIAILHNQEMMEAIRESQIAKKGRCEDVETSHSNA
jgi:hypothetical protein